MTKDDMIAAFDPNAAAGQDSGIYGLPFGPEFSDVVLVPVPWEVTVSYGGGTSTGPEAILEGSMQVDLHHHDYPELWKRGIHMDIIPEQLSELNHKTRVLAEQVIEAEAEGKSVINGVSVDELRDKVNAACDVMNAWVKKQCDFWLKQGKLVGVVGGDHSVPLGYLELQGERHENFGILQIDAHMDLRQAYEGFTFSHASIFYNTLQRVPQVSKLVQVGIRDYCKQEADFVSEQSSRISVFFDQQIRRQMFKGHTWDNICNEIVAALPQKVHLSVDIDGLNPQLCPNTGTPVPGGFEFAELMHLFNVLKNSGKTIIGFDLCEVAPGADGWDGNVGARVLYQLCGTLAG